MKYNKVGIIFNESKTKAAEYARTIEKWLLEQAKK